MEVTSRRGGTISFREVPDFDQLSLEEATHIIYNELVPACEEKEIMLSQYGNHNAVGSLCDVRQYQERKTGHNLFDVARIQGAFSSLPAIVRTASQYRTGSYGLKHVVEDHSSQKQYITNGDLIVAMLLRGYEARFGKINEPMHVNCEFRVLVKKT